MNYAVNLSCMLNIFLRDFLCCAYQFYVGTIKQMALRQLVVGSPLRTLCLLIAGQPTELFSVDTTTNSNLPGGVSMSQQPTQVRY